jgi:hypothetical protein
MTWKIPSKRRRLNQRPKPFAKEALCNSTSIRRPTGYRLSAKPTRRLTRCRLAFSCAPAAATRRPRNRACRTSWSIWSSRAPRNAPSTWSTATLTASVPATMPTPARSIRSSTRCCYRSFCPRPSTFTPTSSAPACASRTLRWKSRSFSMRSACTPTSRTGWPTIMCASCSSTTTR